MPFFYMMFSVLSWSLFPLISAWGIDKVGVFDLIFWSYVVSLVSCIVILRCIPGYKMMKLPTVRQLNKGVLVEIFFGCISVLLSFACLLISFSYVSKAGATIIYEVWPIIAMYISPLLIKKGWDKISSKDLIFSILAFAGVGFLIYPETTGNFFEGMTVREIYRLSLPLLGGILMAVASVLKARVSYNLENKSHPVASLLKVQAYFNVGVIILSLPLMLFWPGKESVYTPQNIAGIAFMGVVIYTLGNVAYTMGVLRSAKPNIVVLWYLMPVFAVLWLWLAGQAEINAYIIFGAAFIITSNLIITVKADTSISYPATMITMLLCGVYTYFVPGFGMDNYYEALSVPIVFYAILAAFMMDRLIRRDRLEEELAIDMINYIERHAEVIGDAAKRYAGHILGIVTTNDPMQVNRHYRAVRNDTNKQMEHLYTQLDQLALSKAQGTSFSEIFILFIVCILTVTMSVAYRPDSFIADIFGIILPLTVMFIFFTVVDLSDKRRQFYLERDYKGDRTLSQHVIRDMLSERIISSVLILMVLAALVGLLWTKYQVH